MCKFSDETLLKYNVSKDEVEDIHKKFKLYQNLIKHEKKLSLSDEEKEANKNTKYTCEICDKRIRVSNRYFHERTQEHKRKTV